MYSLRPTCPGVCGPSDLTSLKQSQSASIVPVTRQGFADDEELGFNKLWGLLMLSEVPS